MAPISRSPENTGTIARDKTGSTRSTARRPNATISARLLATIGRFDAKAFIIGLFRSGANGAISMRTPNCTT